MVKLTTPISSDAIKDLRIGDVVSISGYIYCGRDAVLPKIVELIHRNELEAQGIDLKGAVIFHTAVSPAGVGPTSSNKLEIEGSIPALSKAGVRLHLGKGAISASTSLSLKENESVFAIIPPVTALLNTKTYEKEQVAFPELGMEAFYRVRVEDYQAIIASANGESIY